MKLVIPVVWVISSVLRLCFKFVFTYLTLLRCLVFVCSLFRIVQ